MKFIHKFEIDVYNSFLKVSGEYYLRPWKYVKSVDHLTEDLRRHLHKISTFLIKHPYIDIYSFFKAPYHFHKDQFYHLDFYTTRKAINFYTNFKKETSYTSSLEMDPDSKVHIDSTMKSLKFILEYCKDNKIRFQEYKKEKLKSGIFLWIYHYKQGNINMYTLIGLFGVEEIFKMDRDLYHLYFGESSKIADINLYKLKYYQSTKQKALLNKFNEKTRK